MMDLKIMQKILQVIIQQITEQNTHKKMDRIQVKEI